VGAFSALLRMARMGLRILGRADNDRRHACETYEHDAQANPRKDSA
jgi:hypothetical protein